MNKLAIALAIYFIGNTATTIFIIHYNKPIDHNKTRENFTIGFFFMIPIMIILNVLDAQETINMWLFRKGEKSRVNTETEA